MSEYRGLVFRSEVAARRAVARGEWLMTVANDRSLDPIARAVLTDQRTLDAWWPNPHTDKKTEAA